MDQINILNNPNSIPINITDYFKPSAMRTMHLESWTGINRICADIPCCVINNNIDNIYISMTGIAHAFKPNTKPSHLIRGWLRTKSTMEFLCVWEHDHGNINFIMPKGLDTDVTTNGHLKTADITMSACYSCAC